MPVNALGGAVYIGPQQEPRPAGAEGAPIAARGGVQPAAGDAVRPVEPGGEARGGLIDRRAEDNRRATTAFEELRRTLAGGDDPVALSAEGRRRSQETSADVFARAFGASGASAGRPSPGRPSPDSDFFARPQPGSPPPGGGPTEPTKPGFGGLRGGEAAESTRPFPPGPPLQGLEPAEDRADGSAEGGVIPPSGGNEAVRADGARPADASEPSAEAQATEGEASEAADGTNRRSADGDPLTPEELEQVRQLEVRDAEVRTHEQAHKSVGGRYAGAISYDYQTGPDGRRYAVGGEVSIDISEVPGDPQATIQKMEIVRRAALAPAEPSGADRSVAAAAGQKAAQARVELAEQKTQEAVEAREEAAESSEGVREAAEVDGDEVPAAPGTAGPDRAAGEGDPPPRPAVDGSRIRRITPGEGGGIFVDRRDDAAPAAPSGPRVAALRATGG